MKLLEQPLISIALCTYNGKEFITELINSILNQSISPNEIIIVDDCSTDGTLEILKQYAQKHDIIKLFPLSANVGPVRAFIKAISLTSNQYIFLADQDDIWKPFKIEKMLVKTESLVQPLPFVIYSDLEMINENGETIYPSFWKMANLYPTRANFKNLMHSNVITGSACMINDLMKEELKNTPNDILMHDHWIALIAYGFGNHIYTEEQLVKYRVHRNSVTKKEQVNLLSKIKNQLLQLIKPQKSFLDMEITQMEKYAELYLHHLSPSDQKALSEFISLKEKSFLQKKIYSYSRKIISG